ncbi:MAG TPA: zinc ABC transporter substrate-binding protein [Acidimicrobiales bacterium]|nr:zinc ABC transporter substrate-binding protein [Acidimicrobiales bacterium]
MIASKALVLAGTLVLAAACSAAPSTAPVPGAATAAAGIPVVAAESQYGDVAAQIGGPYTRVTSVIRDPNTDPHSYEISTTVAREVGRARLVVQNGAGYDGFMDRIEAATPSRSRRVVVAGAVTGRTARTANPHLWYDPATMSKVAASVAAALGAIDPGHARYFESNAARFEASLQPWTAALHRLRVDHPGFPVAATEPVADYLLQAAGARILTPYSFQADIMNGLDPAPQGISAQQDLLTHRKVKVLVYNEQVTDSLTSGLIGTARRAGVPVVGVYEIMPVGDSYQQWMLSTVAAIQKAVGTR